MILHPRTRMAVRLGAGVGMLALLLSAGGLAASADDARPPAAAPAELVPAPADPAPATADATPAEADATPTPAEAEVSPAEAGATPAEAEVSLAAPDAVPASTAPAEAELVPEVVPVVTSPTLPAATLGQLYSYQLTANVTPATFSVVGLPAGLTFEASTARIVGTPTALGTSIVRLEAFGEAATDVSQARYDTLEVVAPVVEPARITSLPLEPATVGSPYSFQLTSNVSPVTFSVSGLPAGLAADPQSGLISGTPTAAGSSTVRLEATGERVGEVSEVVYATLVVNPAAVIMPEVTSLPLPSGSVDVPYRFQLTSSVPQSTFRATGLPAGLLLDGSTGLISGTPTREGSFSVGLTAIAPRGGDVTQTVFVTLLIGPKVAVVDPTTPPTDPSTVGSGSGSGSGSGGGATGSTSGGGSGSGATASGSPAGEVTGSAAASPPQTAAGATASAGATPRPAQQVATPETPTAAGARAATADSRSRAHSLAETGAALAALATPGLLAATLLGAGLTALGFRSHSGLRSHPGARSGSGLRLHPGLRFGRRSHRGRG